MGIIDDPISGTIGVMLQHAMESKVGKRVTLVLEMTIAGVLSYFLADGSQLVLGKPWAYSHGWGLLAAGFAMLATFTASPNSKGLTLSLEKDVVEQEKSTPMEEIKK